MKIVEFGEKILRQQANPIAVSDINSAKIQNLIIEMKRLLKTKKLGVGLAAVQVGHNLRLAVIIIQPTKNRPIVEPYELVIINPKLSKTYGNRSQKWEGCISGGPSKSSLFAKVPRYKKLDLKYLDESGREHTKTLSGLPAQVIQHEIDHLNGVLFVDRVKDTKTYTTYKQYLKIVRASRGK